MTARPLVEWLPGSETDLVIMKPCWMADFCGETAVFPTKDEALDFCWKRWRIKREDVLVRDSKERNDG